MMVVIRWCFIVCISVFVGKVVFVDMVIVIWVVMIDGVLVFMVIYCCVVCVWCVGLVEGNFYELRWLCWKFKFNKI